MDLVQLHSCDVDVLERGDAIDALIRAREAGKTRFASFSGDNEAAKWAVESGIFATLQTSYNLVDQHARTKGLFDMAQAAGMGVILKRPVANGVWWQNNSPYPYADEYFRRSQAMKARGAVRARAGRQGASGLRLCPSRTCRYDHHHRHPQCQSPEFEYRPRHQQPADS